MLPDEDSRFGFAPQPQRETVCLTRLRVDRSTSEPDFFYIPLKGHVYVCKACFVTRIVASSLERFCLTLRSDYLTWLLSFQNCVACLPSMTRTAASLQQFLISLLVIQFMHKLFLQQKTATLAPQLW
uniref:Protein yippee-like n=1 Tax=Panagrellus redivivus TaxID=6233 RepID=A0A7E4W5D2_PANRE